MRTTRTTLLIGALLLATACGGGGSEDADEGEGPDDTVEETEGTEAPDGEGWTVLLYSIADTDLEPFLISDVAEMAEVGSAEGVNLVALVDRAAEYSSDPLLNLEDWQGAKLLDIEQGEATELEDMGDVNTGDPQVLADFITRGITENPAARYSLVISDHGASWPGVGGDESSDHDGLDLAEIDAAIAAGLEGAGVEKLDLLGFDACLMATYEVASTLAPYADRLLASQELEPGHGWDYTAFQVLVDDPSTDVDTLGTALVDGFAGQAAAEGTEAEITLSLVDLNQMGAVDDAMSAFSGALAERVADVAPVVGAERATTLGFGRNPDPTQDTHMADLGILASEIGVEALDVSDEADALVRAINDAVVHKVDGQATRGATGLSIYFPPQADLYSAAYDDVPSAADWAAFLAGYYDAGASIPEEEQPQFLNVDGNAEVFFDQDGLNIVGTFDVAAEDNLSEATITYGLVEPDGSITFLGEEPGAIAEDGSGRAIGIYDLTMLTISDGIDTATAYVGLTFDEESGVGTIDVPIAYYAPEDIGTENAQDVLLSIVFDPETGDVLNETYYVYDEDLGTYGELTTDPEGLIVPKVLNVAEDGTETWVSTSDVGLFADLPSLQYSLEPLATGTELFAQLTVTDFGGNSDSVSAVVTVP